MNIPVRMIGIATTIFWVFLIIFCLTAVYSVKDLQFSFGEPQLNMTPDNTAIFSLPVNILNRGYYDLHGFNVTTGVRDEHGSLITRGSTFIPLIRRDEPMTVLHNMTININDLLEHSQEYLFNDTTLNVDASVGINLIQLIPAQASGNFTIPWGAPLYNLQIGNPSYAMVNFTHFRASVPISFENHALFDLTGNVQIRMFDNANVQIGEGQSAIQAYQHSSYSDSVDLLIHAPSIITPTPSFSGHLEVTIETPMFNYGPLVIPVG